MLVCSGCVDRRNLAGNTLKEEGWRQGFGAYSAANNEQHSRSRKREAHYKAKRAEDKVSNEEDALPKTAAAQVLARTAVATQRHQQDTTS